MTSVEDRLQAIEERNSQVEADKAWETSWTRRLIITSSTYLVACVYMYFLKIDGFYLHALVPTGGYFLSTLSLPILRRIFYR